MRLENWERPLEIFAAAILLQKVMDNSSLQKVLVMDNFPGWTTMADNVRYNGHYRLLRKRKVHRIVIFMLWGLAGSVRIVVLFIRMMT